MSGRTVSGCPAEDAIAAFVTDELDEGEREAIERHMDACPACEAVVTEMVRVFAASRIPTRSPDTSLTPDGDLARDPEQLATGASIGRYRVLEVVGMGGMGIVYAAEDPELERRVAVKVLRTRGDPHAHADSQRLLREARAMAKLSHPNVIPVHDVGTWNDRVFVAMELVDGWTLKRWLEQHERTWDSVWPVLRAAGRGVAAAHEAGFVHRDLKPDNVLVSKRGRVFVTDFGLARWAEGGTAEATTFRELSLVETHPVDSRTEPEQLAALTKSGAFVGTPAYMAPEQFARQPVGPACDQFAYCVVVWEALFGERPFQGRSVAALAHAVCETEPPPFPAGVHVPRNVKAALLRGLAKDPRQRHASMAALLTALEPTRRAWLPWSVAGAAAALGLGVALRGIGGDELAASAPCSNLPGLAEVWNDAHETAIATAFAQTAARYAEPTSTRAIAALDEYAQTWAARELEVCEGQQQGSLDPARAAMRRDCLDRSRELFTGIVAGLEQADVALVDRALRVVAGLPELDACADDARLSAELPPTPPAEQAAEVEAIRVALLAADADLQLGRYAAGLERVDALVERATRLGFRPLVAEVAYTRGRLLANLARNDEAATELERAELEGTASRHLQIAAKAAIMHVYAMGRRHDEWPAIASMVKRAEAGAEAAGLTSAERSALWINAAVGAYYAGELELAEDYSQRALALIDRESQPLRWATASLNLASYQRKRGEVERALPTIRDVIEVSIAQLGRVHPDVAEAYRELAISLRNLERFDDAREAARESLAITAEAMGEAHYSYGGGLSTLSGIEGAAGRYDEALRLAERSSQVLAAAGQSTQIPDAQRAEWLVSLGRPDDAAPIVDALMADEVERRGAESPSLSWIWFVRCSVEAARKDVDATRAACDRAIELAAAPPGSDNELAMQLDRAMYLVDAGAGEAALPPLLALLPRVEAAAPSPTTARAFRELAERSWAFVDRRARARAWMERAHAQLVQLELAESARETQAWLDAHAL